MANKTDLIDRIAEETNQTRTAVKKTVQSFLNHVVRELSDGNRVEFRGFGIFEIRERAPRAGQNPRTLEPITIPGRKTVKFKVGRLMQMALDGDTSELERELQQTGSMTFDSEFHEK